MPKGLSAFGADFGFIADRTGTVGLRVYLANGSVESDNVFVGEPKQFFGYVGEEIDRIEIDLPGNDYLVFDNVAFGQSLSAVPEPSTITLAILGLGGCVLRYRRRFRMKQAS